MCVCVYIYIERERIMPVVLVRCLAGHNKQNAHMKLKG